MNFPKRLAASLAICVATGASLISARPVAAQESPSFLGAQATRVQVASTDGARLCNSDIFSQVPNHVDFFIGRAKETTDSNPCSGRFWNLALFRMDWSTNTLKMVGVIFRPGESATNASDGVALSTAYDPTIAFYNGEYWVAFECVSFIDGRAWSYGTSSCLAPLTIGSDITKAHIEQNRISVVVSSTSSDQSSPYIYSASVPKLAPFKGKLYLYWGAIQIEKGTRRWIGSAARGMELTQEATGLRRMWGAGSTGRTVASYDTSRNVEVFAPSDADPRMNSLAALMGVYTRGNFLYGAAAVGGSGCVKPSDPVVGCFRFQIVRAKTPLGEHVFNQEILSSPPTVFNPQEYTRIYSDPNGNQFAMGSYYDSPNGKQNAPDEPFLPAGEWRYPIDFQKLTFKSNAGK
jgi:hypothetical protein